MLGYIQAKEGNAWSLIYRWVKKKKHVHGICFISISLDEFEWTSKITAAAADVQWANPDLSCFYSVHDILKTLNFKPHFFLQLQSLAFSFPPQKKMAAHVPVRVNDVPCRGIMCSEIAPSFCALNIANTKLALKVGLI
jgi:hypothetical protein